MSSRVLKRRGMRAMLLGGACLGVLAVAASDVTRAEIKARKVIRLAPNWYKGHLLLSQILQITGKNQEAARESALSESLGWKKQ